MRSLLFCCLVTAYASSCQTGTDTTVSNDTEGPTTNHADTTSLQPKDSLTSPMVIRPNKSSATQQKALAYTRTYLREDIEKNVIDSNSRRILIEEIDLNNDGQKEMFVGFTGPYFCGSGGCSMLLFDQNGKVITRFTVVRYPVGIDSEMTGGWKNLILESNSGSHLLKYDGKKYPSNPSVLPHYDLKKNKGMEAIFVTDDLDDAIVF